MLGIATKKGVKKSFEEVKNDIAELRKEVRNKVLEPSPRTSTEKQIKRVIDNQKIMNAIHSCIKEGYSTSRIKEDIMLRFGIKKTCFFKYYKLVRNKVLEPSPRTSLNELNKEVEN